MPLAGSDIRRQFPFLREHPSPIYLDNAAMAQVPDAVLDAVASWERSSRSNVHRGMHARAEASTVAYEDARATVQTFLNAAHAEEIIFAKSCTEAINLVARSWGDTNLRENDAVLLSIMEHHSNIIPWQQLTERTGGEVLWADIDDNGTIRIDDLQKQLDSGCVKLVAITAQSNVLGTVPDIRKIIALAHEAGALTLIDAAQAIAHMPIDVQELGCDFLAFSGHKLYGPTGIGVLYGKRKLLESMPPFLGGGMMIGKVMKDGFTAADLPAKFEAGTPPVAQAVGLAAAIRWLTQYPWKDVQKNERELLECAVNMLRDIPGLQLLSHNSQFLNSSIPQFPRGCLSFTLEGIHPHDLTDILGRQGIALRAGHHCCMPLHARLGIAASNRISVGIYNTEEEMDVCARAIAEIQNRFRGKNPNA